jgi:hypothetical protein
VAAKKMLLVGGTDENDICRRDAVAAAAMVGNAVWKQYLFPESLKKHMTLPNSVLLKTFGAMTGWR